MPKISWKDWAAFRAEEKHNENTNSNRDGTQAAVEKYQSLPTQLNQSSNPSHTIAAPQSPSSSHDTIAQFQSISSFDPIAEPRITLSDVLAHPLHPAPAVPPVQSPVIWDSAPVMSQAHPADTIIETIIGPKFLSWAIEGAPDAQSMIQALRVLTLLGERNKNLSLDTGGGE